MMNNELRPYEDYNDSQIMWIGKLPTHWKYLKLRTKFSERRTKVSDKDYMPLSVTKLGIVPQLATAAKSNDGDNRKLVKEGDYVINSRSDRKGSSGLSNYDGSVSLINIVLEPNEIDLKYAHYLFRSNMFIDEYYRNGRGIVADLWTTRFSEMKNIYIPVPSEKEQVQIVKYLDHQLFKINKFIMAKKKLIAVLKEQKQAIINEAVTKGLDPNVKMKPSGIDGVGNVPEHWAILMNRRIFKENCRSFSNTDEIVLSLSQKEGLIPYAKMKERSLHTSTYENWKLVYLNDLVLNRFKAHLGVFFSSEYRGIVTFHYGVYEPKVKLISKYYEHLYHTNSFKSIYAGRSNGMTIGLQNLSNQNFYNVYTLMPQFEEQVEIVEYIEREVKKVDLVIGRIESEIQLISEYKNSLISEIVTGKIDVRHIIIDENEEINLDDFEVDEDVLDIGEMLEDVEGDE